MTALLGAANAADSAALFYYVVLRRLLLELAWTTAPSPTTARPWLTFGAATAPTASASMTRNRYAYLVDLVEEAGRSTAAAVRVRLAPRRLLAWLTGIFPTISPGAHQGAPAPVLQALAAAAFSWRAITARRAVRHGPVLRSRASSPVLRMALTGSATS